MKPISVRPRFSLYISGDDTYLCHSRHSHGDTEKFYQAKPFLPAKISMTSFQKGLNLTCDNTSVQDEHKGHCGLK